MNTYINKHVFTYVFIHVMHLPSKLCMLTQRSSALGLALGQLSAEGEYILTWAITFITGAMLGAVLTLAWML